MGWLSMEQWSPYIVGIGIGILSWLTFLLSDKPIGCSTAFTRTSGMIERLFRGAKVKQKPYYQKFAPTVDWEWMLVLGIVIGAFVSSKLSGQFQLRWTPVPVTGAMDKAKVLVGEIGFWRSQRAAFVTVPYARIIVAFIGGILMGIGARWAGGCTSGHGISGTLQLAVSSWLAAICFFIGGIATAMLIFRIIAG